MIHKSCKMNTMEASTVTVNGESNLISRWIGDGADAIPLEMRTAIEETVTNCARRLPVNVKVFICDRIQEVEDGHFLCAAVTRGNRRYVYVMERHYTIIFNMQDVNGIMMITLMENNVGFLLP